MYVYITDKKHDSLWRQYDMYVYITDKKHDSLWGQYNMYVYITAKETRQTTKTKYAHIFFVIMKM